MDYPEIRYIPSRKWKFIPTGKTGTIHFIMTVQPALFLPHGAPTFALSPGHAGAAIQKFAASLKKPAAILVVSAHWNTDIPMLGASRNPQTIHDFWGFPEELYGINYPAKGSPELARHASKLLNEAGIEAGVAEKRGLDHGAWIPLRTLYPDASIPVAPLSLQYRNTPEHHYRLGEALASLKREGILIASSGNLTHNLFHYRQDAAGTPSYVIEFRSWFREKLQAKDINSLLNYRKVAPGALEAHPTDEHLLPLFVALGAAGANFGTEFIFEGVYDGSIAMDAFAFHSI